MRRQRVIDTLDHPVVEDIRSLIECALRGKHQQMIEQQTPGGQPLHEDVYKRQALHRTGQTAGRS